MKSVHKILSSIALSGIMSLAFALSASAQHDHTIGGGGGGGSHSSPAPSSGGGGGHSNGGFPSSSRPAPSSTPTFSRPSYSGHTNTSQPRPNVSNNNNVNRPNTIGRPNFSQRSGAVNTNPVQQQYSGHVIGGAQRVGVTPQSSYRTYQGSVYGHNHPGSPYGRDHYHGYLPGNTSYHYNRGYFGTYYRPRLGFSIGVLPYGYYPFYWGDYEYFYSDGLFYQYNNDEYTVVDPPVGAEVTSMPSNAQSIVINGQQFYEVNGVYYKPVTKDDGTLVYEVAGKDGELNTDDNGDDYNAPPAPQIGDVIQQLPQGSRKLNINGQVMYMSPDGVYYQSFTDANGNPEYKIVGLPDESDDNGGQGGQQ